MWGGVRKSKEWRDFDFEDRMAERAVGWVERSKKINVQHRTSNVQYRMKKQAGKLVGWEA